MGDGLLLGEAVGGQLYPDQSYPAAAHAVLAESEAGDRRARVIEQIEAATFTGKGDKEAVPQMYKDYVKRIASALQSTLALEAADTVTPTLPPMPTIR